MPDKVGRYEIRGELGQGGMAVVYRGYDPRFGREVAVKLVHQHFAADEKLRLRFEREARTIAALEHPAIVPVYDFGEEAERPYLIMRLMSGGSLKGRLVERGPLSPEETIAVLRRIGPALDEAHAQGIVHRDLKPGNILFDRFDAPYLSDFGIVRLAESDATLTGNQSIGTPGYMSPEQIENQGVDSRTDVYALGVMIFQMLSGQLPYNATSAAMIMLKHMTEPVPEVHLINPAVPPRFSDIIAVCMAKKKEQRPPTAADVVEMLTDALAHADTAVAARDVTSEPAETGGEPQLTLFPTRSTGRGHEIPSNAKRAPSAPVGKTEVALPDFTPSPPAEEADRRRAKRGGRRWLWLLGGIGALGVVALMGLMFLATLGEDETTPPVRSTAAVAQGGGGDASDQDAPTDDGAVAVVLDDGYAALDGNDARAALRGAERCVEIAPDDARCYLLRAEAFLLLGEPGSALPNLNSALERAPDNPDLLSIRGFVLGELGRWEDAVVDLRRAVEVAPEEPFRYLELAVTLVEAGKAREAVATADDCLARFPEEAICFQTRGEALRGAGDFEASSAAYREAIRRDDGDPYLFLALGYALIELDDVESAQRAFESAVERDPENAALLTEVAWAVAYDFEDPEAALLLVNRATQAEPEYAEAYYARASIHRLLEQPGRAALAFRRFLELGGGERCGECADDARTFLEQFDEP